MQTTKIELLLSHKKQNVNGDIMISDLFLFITLLFIGIVIIPYLNISKNYKKTAYYKTLKLPYYRVRLNKGRYGEYLSYKHLKGYEENGAKFLFNVYIPKSETETTEIDVIMISQYGLFVIESKNYSGWIFGDENQYKWTQTLPTGKGKSHKEHFYNPIKQNRGHINYLNTYIDENLPVYSIIAFSDRCKLKSIKVTSPDIKVINRSAILAIVNGFCNLSSPQLSNEKIDEIYSKLYPLTQVNDTVKQQHVNNINSKKTKTVPPVNNTSKTNYRQATQPQNKQAQDTQQGNVCPRCAAPLVVRKTKKGENAGKEFWGCSNFPKCRYKKDI